MIPDRCRTTWKMSSKPRASGDDPALMPAHSKMAQVNPARAGMIPLFY